MINKVFISYNQSEAVTFSFWKYFFEACGIGLESETIAGEWSKISGSGPRLIILGSGMSQYILQTQIEQCAYLVKSNAEYRKYYNKNSKQFRNDVIPMTRWEQIDVAFFPVLHRLISESDEYDRLKDILQIFIEEKFWNTAWLYNEIASEGKSDLDALISHSCNTMSKKLQSLNRGRNTQNNWYKEFALLYCKYIQCGTHERTLMRRLSDCQKLLKECGELAKSYGWMPSLCMFAGKVCALSQVAHKYALDYYKGILEKERTAETYYNIGYIYENYIGDETLALHYYEKASAMDRIHFCSIYKQGVYYETKGEWMLAYTIFNKIVRLLSVRMSPSISVRELEYYYKSLQRLFLICKQNINADEFTNYYRREIETLRRDLKADLAAFEQKNRRALEGYGEGPGNNSTAEKEPILRKIFGCMNMDRDTTQIVENIICAKFKIAAPRVEGAKESVKNISF